MPQPTLGRTVMYRLTDGDAQHITRERVQVGVTGNAVKAGQQYPAIVVRAFAGNPHGVVNLRVLLDGQDPPLWATSRPEGDEPGTWAWPERV